MSEIRIQQFDANYPLSAPVFEAMRLSACALIGMELDTPEQVDAYAGDLAEYTNFMALSGDVVVATGSVMLEELNERAYIDNVVVAETHRRAGLGSRMTTRLEDFAREAGMPRARLYPTTDPAVKLYTKLGYNMILDPDSGQLEGMEKRLN